MKKRCEWANKTELEKKYHDEEWGVAVHDDQKLFEYLILESMQSGLSWSTILAKRETMRYAYDHFDYRVIATYMPEKIDEIMLNKGVIRNKLKVKSVIVNANAFLKIQEEFGSFDHYIWGFVDGQTIVHQWAKIEDVPARSDLSDHISKDLKKRGFQFLGSVSVYAFLQSIGIVDDHMRDCFRKISKM